MAKADYALKVGDRVELPYTDNTLTRLCDSSWNETQHRATATVVGWNTKEQPVVMIDEGFVGGMTEATLYHPFVDKELCPDPTKRRFWYLCSKESFKKVDSKVENEKAIVKKTQRQTIVAEMLKHLENTDYFYGGVVRDQIRNEDFVDVNLFMAGKEPNNYVSKLQAAGFKVNFVSYAKDGQGKDITTKPLYSVSKNGYEVMMDVVVGNNTLTTPLTPGTEDADVNMLAMKKDGVIFSMLPEVNVAETTDRIKKGTYKELPGINDDRRKKLKQKGFGTKTTKTTSKVATKKESKTMSETSDKQTFMDMFKGDAENAAYRVASTQIAKGVKVALLRLMESKGLDGGKMAAVKDLLETEIGTALVDAIAGLALTYMPKISDDPRVQKLAGEFRTQSLTIVGNEVIGAAVEHFLPVLTSALSNLPSTTTTEKGRIGETTETEVVEEETASPKVNHVN